MPRTCINCFVDKDVRYRIQRSGAETALCPYCRSEYVLSVEASSLAEAFEVSIDCLEESPEGEPLHSIYEREFKILSSRVNEQSILLEDILGSELTNKRYLLRYNSVEYSSNWDDFKKELIYENRFFPRNSIFSDVFYGGEGGRGCELFIRLIGELGVERKSGERFFRARVSEDILTADKMGMPPCGVATAGRANPNGISYLYLAENENTCVSEVRPTNGCQVYISEFMATRDLKLVDLTTPKDRISLLTFEADEIEKMLKYLNLLEIFSEELCRPVLPQKSSLEYIPTQFLCEYIKTLAGYDGIVFQSSFRTGRNFVLFNSGAVSADEPSRHKVISSSYQWE